MCCLGFLHIPWLFASVADSDLPVTSYVVALIFLSGWHDISWASFFSITLFFRIARSILSVGGRRSLHFLFLFPIPFRTLFPQLGLVDELPLATRLLPLLHGVYNGVQIMTISPNSPPPPPLTQQCNPHSYNVPPPPKIPRLPDTANKTVITW